MTDSMWGARRPRVFIVEDEFLIAAELQAMLEELGCELAGSAGSVEEALDAISTIAADAAILDLVLHDVRAYPVAEALAARGIPFGFATGFDVVAEDSWQDRPIITKPYSTEDVGRLVRALLPGRLR